MTRGTIALVGPINRETELVCARLEKEAFLVVKLASAAGLRKWLSRNHAQVVLMTGECTKPTVSQTLNLLTTQRKNRYIASMALAGPVFDNKPKGLGDVFHLHQIPLAKLVERLRFAIQLCQLAQQLQL